MMKCLQFPYQSSIHKPGYITDATKDSNIPSELEYKTVPRILSRRLIHHSDHLFSGVDSECRVNSSKGKSYTHIEWKRNTQFTKTSRSPLNTSGFLLRFSHLLCTTVVRRTCRSLPYCMLLRAIFTCPA